jgi:hypothetical protein
MKRDTRRPIRQGDVLLVPVDDSEAEGARPMPRENGRLIIARGETTGHAHQVMECGSAIWDGAARRVLMTDPTPAKDQTAEILTAKGGAILVRAFKGAQLVHEEHKPHDLIGTYQYVPQVEHRPWGEQRVLD